MAEHLPEVQAARDGQEADERLRAEVRAFLAEHLSPALRQAGRRTSGIFTDHDEGMAWWRVLAARGWAVPHWPVAWGGTGWTPRQQAIFAAELAAADAPQLAPQGARMVAPVLLAFGTPAQQQRWLPAIRDGHDYWCQGYSEPGAGSDLAALQCRAVRGVDAQGAHFIVNGTKIWTTHAQWANRIFCLVRTGTAPQARPQQGISFLLFDMDLPGISVRPIISLSGDHELNQVFFDNVRVPADALLGDENQGWTIAKYLLAHERGGPWSPLLRARLARITAWAQQVFDGPAAMDDEARTLHLQLAEARTRLDALAALEQQWLDERALGREAAHAPSMAKVLGSELKQHLTELHLAVAGPHAAAALPLDQADAHALALPEDALFAMRAYLNDRAASLYAGTNEVQRNLIARALLAGGPVLSPVMVRPDDTQTQVVDSLQRWLHDMLPFQRRAAWLATADAAAPLWHGLAQGLGLLGAALPEAVGGQGGGLADQLLIARALGAALWPEPWHSSVVLGAGLLQHLGGPSAQALLRGLVGGTVRLALAHAEPGHRHDGAAAQGRLHLQADGPVLYGRKALVRAAPQATHWLVTATDEAGALRVALVSPGVPGVVQRVLRTVDGHWAAELQFDGTPVDELLGDGDARAALAHALDTSLLVHGAEAIGLMDRLMADTVAHLTQRRQFGQPLAQCQALQHRLADMHLAHAQAAALLGATLGLRHAPAAQRHAAAAAVQLRVAEAARLVSQGAVQLHGAMGMTDELPVGHAVKRLTLLQRQGGAPVHYLRAVAEAHRPPPTP